MMRGDNSVIMMSRPKSIVAIGSSAYILLIISIILTLILSACFNKMMWAGIPTPHDIG